MRLPIKVVTLFSGGDKIAPTVVITSTETSPSAAATIPITITFSESVTGFVVGDITVAGCTLSDFAGSGAVYTVTATPTLINMTVDIAAGVCVDGAGNENTAATQFVMVSILGLADYWKLGEASGNRLDSVGGRSMVPAGTVGTTTGKIGNCVTASGSGNYLSTAVDESLLAIDWSAGFSVVGWVFVPTAYSGRNTVLAKGDSSAADWLLYSNAQNAHRMFLNDSVSGSSLAVSTTNITLDAWHFMAGRYNPSTKKAEFRLDAEAWTLGGALTNGPLNVKNKLTIANFGGLYGNAYYDEVGLWTRYLTNEEVDALYASGAGATYPF